MKPLPVARALANQRAADAEAAVLERFVGRFLYLPATQLARTVTPAHDVVGPVGANVRTLFRYWWQAHLLDAVIDGALRSLRAGDVRGAMRSALLGRQLLRTIRIRNFGTLRKHFFDDMAWLALAIGRLDELHRRLGATVGQGSRHRAQEALTRALQGGQDTGGGIFWNRDRNFINAAASGPAALHMVRSGRRAQGRAVAEWIHHDLLNDQGLIVDGLRTTGKKESRVYTYNQGPILAVLLELGEPGDVERAGALVNAVREHLATPSSGVIMTRGTGDGGLFAGILVRYLALAAQNEKLDQTSRKDAARMVHSTAAALWEGRSPSGIFPATIGLPDVPLRRQPTSVELSTQVQGWMVMEAAATLSMA